MNRTRTNVGGSGRDVWTTSDPHDSNSAQGGAPKIALSRPTDELPPQRPAPLSRILPANLDDLEYVHRFVREFGIQPIDGHGREIFVDVTGERLLVGDAIFRERDGRLKIRKRGRERHVLLLADTIRTPDEIWQTQAIGSRRTAPRRRYLGRWQVGGREIPTVAVFEAQCGPWVGITAFQADTTKYVNTIRQGERFYLRAN